MPPAKAFWNALVVAFLPVLAMSAVVIYFLKPESRELFDFLCILAVVFGVPGLILSALLYRGYREAPRPAGSMPRTRIGLGITLVVCAAVIVVATLAPLANQRHVSRWELWSSLVMALAFFVQGVHALHRAWVFRCRTAQSDAHGPSVPS
jgi:hypothetical protein